MTEKKKDTVLVIGDAMCDRYFFGKVERISPEAACPVFADSGGRMSRPGGAANVATQIAHAGLDVMLAAKCGRDAEGDDLRKMLEKLRVDCTLMFDTAPVTTLKERLITDANRQVLRIDREESCGFTTEEQEQVLDIIRSGRPDCIVLSDYNKGVHGEGFCRRVIRTAHESGIATIVDIKVPDASRYAGATIVKGNLRECKALAEALQIPVGGDEERLTDTFAALRAKLECGALCVTCGAEGIMAVSDDGAVIRQRPVKRTIFDVTGAGDMVTAYLAIGHCRGISLAEAVRYADTAGGLSVTSLGNPLINPREVFSGVKLIDAEDFEQIRGDRRVVFTNGCFDLLHVGHLDLLSKAREMGDLLVVGLNSDSSVRTLKGAGRPVNKLEHRAAMLSALNSVDYIIPFEDETPAKLVERLRPDVLVKGGDYRREEIAGADFVEANGGQVVTIPFVYDISTTKLLHEKR